MEIHALCVEGAFVIQGIAFEDERGSFREIFHSRKLPKELPLSRLQQISVSSSKEDVLRGLHTSKYYKVISVLKGEIYDVIVDMRKDSPTYLKWSATLLSAENKKQVMVPGGCAHGFLCLKEAIISYLQGGTFDTSQEQVKSVFCNNFSSEIIFRIYAHLIQFLVYTGRHQGQEDTS